MDLREKLPTSIQEARRIKSSAYFTGKPCKHGHISWRYTDSGTCYECYYVKYSTHPNKKHSVVLTTGPSEFHPTTENEKFALKLFKNTARSAKRRNIEFNISYPHLISLINSTTVCPILDVQLVIGNTHKTKNTTPSIDRVNNNVGYIDNNIQIISWRANYLKRDATIVELKQIINYIKNHDNNA